MVILNPAIPEESGKDCDEVATQGAVQIQTLPLQIVLFLKFQIPRTPLLVLPVQMTLECGLREPKPNLELTLKDFVYPQILTQPYQNRSR